MQESVEYIKSVIKDLKPETGIILGSGLGNLADEIQGEAISYSDIPGFKTSGVKGHSGRLVIGSLCSKTVVAMQGRLHYYEGHSLSDVIYPVRVMKELGIENLIITNAAGGVNTGFSAGDLMIIEDHINLMGNNPLIGKNLDEFGPRFVDMSCAYDIGLINKAKDTAIELNIKLQQGIYAALSGPVYETPAEIRMLRTLGADAVGMSTVPEVIAARHMSLKVLGISCITNMAAGILNQTLSHEEVMETSARVQKHFIALLKGIIKRI